MKKTLLSQLLIIHLTSFVIAQTKKADPVLLNVTYQFIHINNLNDKEHPVKKDMVLSVGKTTSRYIAADVYNRSLAPVPKLLPSARVVSGQPVVAVNSGGGIVSESYYQWPLLNQLNIVAILGNKDYLVETKPEKINWEMGNETRKIGGISCQKAVGKYGGRTYIAWFAPDLPFQNGPFKLWGLPGLILEAEDSKKEVRFLFKDINKETDATRKVEPIGSAPIKITITDYNKAKKAYMLHPDTFMQSQLSVGAPKVSKVYETESNDKNAKSKKVIYNPIEL
ncbi:GLPGLI family protein [Pedobacter nutrimenti]|jgi:GLPGLI family protein|uniref:GLPGLI family protein n=1 Tax=Pedobacter nutrimenti TaxID=1241337 RepID=A0A318UL58_9SPHI|nr:GLPGLI family protein [Pedobacter nutrimenti]PYF74755.1 GLPGLI family protein [Pedobacter nutrimenti]